MSIDRAQCLRAIARVKVASARAEPVLRRCCGPLAGDRGIGGEAIQDAVRLRADVVFDLPPVLCLHAAALRLGLAFRADVDFSVLQLPPYSAAAVELFLDEVKASSAPRAGGA